jgi:hypothetical protein
VVPAASMIADVLRLAGIIDYICAAETVDDALGQLREG